MKTADPTGAASPIQVPIPAKAGIGLKAEHLDEILGLCPERVGQGLVGPHLAWLEVHAENYMAEGGAARRKLREIAERYPLSIHGVGLSLGSAQGLDAAHLARLVRLEAEYKPALISEHLAWSVVDGVYLNDLLPVPLTDESLDVVCRNVDQAQQALGRQLLVENPSAYLRFKGDEMSEPAFLQALVERTGCGLLLDVNNVFVSASNFRADPEQWAMAMPLGAVGEIHLAGHVKRTIDGVSLRIDDHGSSVIDPVWRLFERVLAETGPVPALIEWDTDVPTLDQMLFEAAKADRLMARATGKSGSKDHEGQPRLNPEAVPDVA
ncbi:MAG: DUF692 domain-containing protein [Magnetovibrionaceae bacterium]